MKRIHIALGVCDVAQSIADYSDRLGCAPVVVIEGEYALWRTPEMNLSIRRVEQSIGTLRHLGWEDSSVSTFSQESDCNGIVWEKFNANLQAAEIKMAWPESTYEGEG